MYQTDNIILIMKKLLCLLTIAMVIVVGCTPDSDGFTYDSILGDSISSVFPGDSIPSDSIFDDLFPGDSIPSVLPGDSTLNDALHDFFTNCPNNEIRYIADDSLEVDFSNSIFKNKIKLEEHVFEAGYGFLKFSGDVINVPSWGFDSQSSLKAVYLPACVTEIGTSAFGRCKKLESIQIPDSVTKIENYAFEWCEKLDSIIIPGSVEYIGQHAFWYCSSLKELVISEGVMNIGLKAFENCKQLEVVRIPSTVVDMQGYTFKGCENLKTVYLMCETPPYGTDPFDAHVENIYVPAESVELYIEEWWSYANKIRPMDF